MIKRPRSSKRSPPPNEVARFLDLATNLSQSSSRLEDQFWERRLAQEIDSRLACGNESTLTASLDQLYNSDLPSYGNLVDAIESSAESTSQRGNDVADILLLAIPVLAWSRLPIPCNRIKPDILEALRTQLHGHVLAKDARLCLADHFFSPDQLPQSYCETYELMKKLGKSALKEEDYTVDAKALAETAVFLSDTRFLLGCIAVKREATLFRWQEESISRNDAIASWQQQSNAVIGQYFQACAFEVMAPAAYHAAIREADRASRPYSLAASMDFLKTVLASRSDAFQASVASFHSPRQVEEYRIGFGYANSNDILHGVVWPILDPEDESPEAMSRIEQQIRDMGVARVNVLRNRLPIEFCDDCGAPLFPNPEGEAMHAELPTDSNTSMPHQLH
ncbi:MAG: DUF2863 family protein [Rhodocyclaceae bacterium]|nr:DUF2863 family protein [Rhodocyclaceae bacterium]